MTIRKTTSKQYEPPTFEPLELQSEEASHIPAHKDFREKYFQGFKPKTEETEDAGNEMTSSKNANDIAESGVI